MSEALLQPQAMVARSRYVHLRAFLAAALAAIIGLIVAVVLLASSQGTRTVTESPDSSAFQTGATLDHRGLDTSQSSAAQLGAKLHHKG